MDAINILDARNNLSKLVAAAEHGDDVVIARRGRPVVRLVRAEQEPTFTAGAAAVWLTQNPPPQTTERSAAELDAQIAESRDAWQ